MDHDQTERQSRPATASVLVLVALAGVAVASFVAAASSWGDDPAEPVDEPGEEAAMEPDRLPLAAVDCEALGAAADAVVAAGHVGHEAIVALDALRVELPASLHADIERLSETYAELEAGHTSVLFDGSEVEAARTAGDAISDFLDSTCDIDWSAS